MLDQRDLRAAVATTNRGHSLKESDFVSDSLAEFNLLQVWINAYRLCESNFCVCGPQHAFFARSSGFGQPKIVSIPCKGFPRLRTRVTFSVIFVVYSFARCWCNNIFRLDPGMQYNGGSPEFLSLVGLNTMLFRRK